MTPVSEEPLPKHKTGFGFNALGKIFPTMSLDKAYFLKYLRLELKSHVYCYLFTNFRVEKGEGLQFGLI